jgi:hypothetical protein
MNCPLTRATRGGGEQMVGAGDESLSWEKGVELKAGAAYGKRGWEQGVGARGGTE